MSKLWFMISLHNKSWMRLKIMCLYNYKDSYANCSGWSFLLRPKLDTHLYWVGLHSCIKGRDTFILLVSWLYIGWGQFSIKVVTFGEKEKWKNPKQLGRIYTDTMESERGGEWGEMGQGDSLASHHFRRLTGVLCYGSWFREGQTSCACTDPLSLCSSC